MVEKQYNVPDEYEKGLNGRKVYLPSPEEIAAAAAAIRRTWSHGTEQARAGGTGIVPVGPLNVVSTWPDGVRRGRNA